MKQPIVGIAGVKPWAAVTKPSGKLSKEESHALDAEYRRQRNLALQLKNRRGANAVGEGPRRID